MENQDTAMDDTTLDQTLRAMITGRLFLQATPDELDADVPLMETYGVDSVSLLELVVGLEETFGITLDDGDFTVANFTTLAAIRDFVRQRLARGP